MYKQRSDCNQKVTEASPN